MKKAQEFQTTIALAIGLAIIPIGGIVFILLALALAGITASLTHNWLKNGPAWLRYIGVALAIAAIIQLLLPTILSRYS